MINTFESAGKAGKEFLDSGLKSFATLSTNMQAITVEASEYSRKAVETGSSGAQQLVSARSLDKAFEIQADYARQAYEGFIAQSARISELYAEMAKEAYEPFESAIAKARQFEVVEMWCRIAPSGDPVARARPIFLSLSGGNAVNESNFAFRDDPLYCHGRTRA